MGPVRRARQRAPTPPLAHPQYYLDTKDRPDLRAYRTWNNARQRAARGGIPFTITLDWFKDRLTVCAVTGLPFDYGIGGRGYANPFCPSIDQKTPGLGYTPENAQVVVWIYNNAKNTNKHEDVVRFARALVDHEARS